MGLARHESDFEAAAEAQVNLDELLAAFSQPAAATYGLEIRGGCRREAIAHCLSGSEGWRDAAERVGGAFAAIDRATGLTTGKE